MSKSGIYKITCQGNGKIYVGQSLDLGERKRQHWTKLRLGHHRNKRMQEDWNTYGGDHFSFDVLEFCPADKLNEREIAWIKQLDCTNKNIGYNIQVGGAHADKGLTEKPRYKNTTKYKK